MPTAPFVKEIVHVVPPGRAILSEGEWFLTHDPRRAR